MTAEELKQYIGRTIDDIEYEDGSDHAYIILSDGSGVEIPVTPTYEEEEEA